jgi:hypothetical protein
MAKDASTPVPLLTLSEEWAKTREVIAIADGRIHETRKMVFGLFTGLLAASPVVGATRSDQLGLWLGVHVALLALLIVGRFVEQQTFLLQAAAASRAWVLELLTPVELTGTICDRFVSIPTGEGAIDQAVPPGRRTYWPAMTTYIYMGLGAVSLAVTGLVAFMSKSLSENQGYAAGFIVATIVYAVLVLKIGDQDIRFARDGMDWSLSATSAHVGEPVHILLVNQEDDDLAVPQDPAKIVRLEADGREASGADDSFQLRLPSAVPVEGRLHQRGALRWVWKPTKPGLWGLKIKLPNPNRPLESEASAHAETTELFLRRFIYIEPATATRAETTPEELKELVRLFAKLQVDLVP